MRKRKPHSKETREKMSITATGKKFSVIHKKNLSIALKGRKLSKKSMDLKIIQKNN
jgi:hypothetical protein